MKKILLFVLTSLFGLVLVACDSGPKVDNGLQEILAAIEIVYHEGDSSSHVTHNVTLPSAFGEATIMWSTSDANIISITNNGGIVNRGSTDKVVTLTAVVTYQGIIDTVSFELTVIAFEVVIPDGTEIDGAALDALVGSPIYALLPAIYSEDYELVDDSSEAYPVDVYVDLFDWTDEDGNAYIALMDAAFSLDNEQEAYIVGDFLVYVYLEEELYDTPTWSINIFTVSENPVDPNGEIDGAALNALLGDNIYDLLPAIYSADYELVDDSSEEYPVDVYVDLFDWTDEDGNAYDLALDAAFELDEAYGYIVGDFYIYVYLEEELYDTPIWSINIFKVADGGTGPVEPGETVTITSVYTTAQSSLNLDNGNVTSHFSISGDASVTVTYAKNGATVHSIFNNASSEFRLYPQSSGGSGNGNSLTFTFPAETKVTYITLTMGTNNGGLSVNGVTYNTTGTFNVVLSAPSNVVTLKNVAPGASGSSNRVDIQSVVFGFGEGVTPTDPQPTETKEDAINAFLQEYIGVHLTSYAADTMYAQHLYGTASLTEIKSLIELWYDTTVGSVEVLVVQTSTYKVIITLSTTSGAYAVEEYYLVAATASDAIKYGTGYSEYFISATKLNDSGIASNAYLTDYAAYDDVVLSNINDVADYFGFEATYLEVYANVWNASGDYPYDAEDIAVVLHIGNEYILAYWI